MKNLLITTFLLLSCNILFSQHTKEFNAIASKIKSTKTESFIKKYKNGNIKEKATIVYYDFGDYEYNFYTGKRFEYYKNGQVMSEAEHDSFGNILTWKVYYSKGDLYLEYKALKIHTTTDNIERFLRSDKHYKILELEKKYKFSYKHCRLYLFSEGKKRNGKKVGIWKKYYEDGKLRKEVNY